MSNLGINWALEMDSASVAIYTYRTNVLDKTLEVRVLYDKVINKYRLRFIAIKPANEDFVSLLTILTPYFNFTLDYAQENKTVILNPTPSSEFFEDLNGITAFINTLTPLIIELISYVNNPMLKSEINNELINRGWVVDMNSQPLSMFKVYSAGNIVMKVSIDLEKLQFEFGKARIDVLVRALTPLKCVVDDLINNGFTPMVVHDELGMAILEGEFPSLGIPTLLAVKIDDLINSIIKSCS